MSHIAKKYMFMLMGKNIQFLCQTFLDEERFAFHWVVEDDIKPENLYVVSEDEGINPDYIDPVITSAVEQGFKCFMLELPETSHNLDMANARMYPLGSRRGVKYD